ncbi:bifunctional 2-C-methyl-D-erythritol 4-phosphate cytidylyltransferase/2-C-methyl-D-erythritol 2,4-cyclodiphosphate synthase [Aurantimonas sp. 22II-16-19i]|uniref:bifunctional 2-C-methyl-D-erythritol 4-phosphate cytidylyltransferase/2-C-methyl-D-erythritol 2,4-cyclodiphosphate synthase n=1 Tax=Aurantimonas sp. 22II-16-19i TaxID=1317114 RepID=UPI0009F7DC24|nr:bifunctional 2-C-methyl-D-erythritol 4-phosphate cytidylyltransferase/2-C-methyl-D-erythritol 2,4-cyclodiphosphate synthase [Aurantimonas sp. 22II-16-19i]ORE98803.1 bifunctional 2-C-methyl-D-erythritol 4-phosphate cytidylyltransferase/2-C-methyl-D-erythritol 2,4-cyclodiphosphate synthase protein [Aurantimonas sp. 22II-16-19i]
MTESVAAILVAAGRGERAGQSAEGPKQYRRIGGRAVLARSLAAFRRHPRIGPVVIVIHADDRALCEAALGDDAARVHLVTGGAERQISVRCGLEFLAGLPAAPDLVLIHDAVRPFVDAATIDRVIDAAIAHGGAIPALPVSDTLKRAGEDGRIAETVPRKALFGAQTPQGFRFDGIRQAHAAAARSGRSDFTDDASIAEWAEMEVRLVAGTAENVKLTTREDIAAADDRLKERLPMIDVRTGNGYDVHRLVPGDHVTLCGVRIAHDQRLDGHSDADVGLHALTDALLATCGAGDIGDHFPPSDPQWKGAASHIFVEKAVEIVAAKGGRIMNADISLICEAPKIAPHREAMREAIAKMTGLSLDRVSVKATTNETIGFVGRREGIAAIATASVAYGETQ